MSHNCVQFYNDSKRHSCIGIIYRRLRKNNVTQGEKWYNLQCVYVRETREMITVTARCFKTDMCIADRDLVRQAGSHTGHYIQDDSDRIILRYSTAVGLKLNVAH